MTRREDRNARRGQRRRAANRLVWRPPVAYRLGETIDDPVTGHPLVARRCTGQKKIIYASQDMAMRARNALAGGDDPVLLHAYPCPTDGHWHLTTQSQPETCRCRRCKALNRQNQIAAEKTRSDDHV